jgi:hypothetical protein
MRIHSGVPQAVKTALRLARGERVLAASRAADDSYIVATGRALYRGWGRPGSPEDGHWRLPYEDILRVVWDDEAELLRVWEPSLPDGYTEVPLPDPGAVPETVRERVTSTLVVSHHVPLQGKRGVWLSARRSPAESEVRWTMLFDAGLDPTDPGLRTLAAAALEELRESTGV